MDISIPYYEDRTRKITIELREDWSFGCCGCDPLYVWIKKEVTPEELVRLIDRCETIKIIH